jgi:hypothetical protein
MIDIGNHPFAHFPDDRREQRHAAWRHVYDLTRKLSPVRKHVGPPQIDFDALESPPFFFERQYDWFLQCERHEDRRGMAVPAPFVALC